MLAIKSSSSIESARGDSEVSNRRPNRFDQSSRALFESASLGADSIDPKAFKTAQGRNRITPTSISSPPSSATIAAGRIAVY